MSPRIGALVAPSIAEMMLVCYNVFGLFARHLSWAAEGGYRNTLYYEIPKIDYLNCQYIRAVIAQLTHLKREPFPTCFVQPKRNYFMGSFSYLSYQSFYIRPKQPYITSRTAPSLDTFPQQLVPKR